MMTVKPNPVILIGLALLGALFVACARPGNIQPEFEPPEFEEPRAIIQGEGVDIKGEAYLSDILYSGGNFWAQGVPKKLEQWMNKRTKVNVRFMPQPTAMKSIYLSVNVRFMPQPTAMKSIYLSPPDDVPLEQVHAEGMFKQPILLLSGKNGQIDFTPAERENLRKYLVEQGGFLFIDYSSTTESEFYRSMRQMLKTVLPTHSVKLIPNDHEIYNCFYQMSGPPVGSAGYKPLEGIFINSRLVVLINSTGYWDIFSGVSDYYSPGVLRFGVNLMIYAMTHGQKAVVEPEAVEFGTAIQGNDGDIAGHIYLSDVLYSDGNFWSQGVPAYLEQWMNERTKVNVRFMPQETLTKSVYLAPPVDISLEGVDTEGVFKQPILLLSGKNHQIYFTPAEQENLRKYLVERGGFLFIDDTSTMDGEFDRFMRSINGSPSVDGRFYRSVREMLEAVLPSHPVEAIPNDHEIYNCFYQMNGPPVGLAARRRPLTGIFINGRLAVLINRGGYWEAFTGRGSYSPGVLRFGVNLMIYAVTRGQISDKSAYNR